jgi:hypothetical protein
MVLCSIIASRPEYNDNALEMPGKGLARKAGRMMEALIPPQLVSSARLIYDSEKGN